MTVSKSENVTATFEDVINVSIAFSNVLHNWLTPIQIAQVVERNGDEREPRICHSHDFCDANMAMDAAFRKVFGRAYDDESAVDGSIWGFAWHVAKEAGFCTDTIKERTQ